MNKPASVSDIQAALNDALSRLDEMRSHLEESAAEEQAARKRVTHYTNAINDIRKEVQSLMDDLAKAMPRGTDWKRNPVGCVAEEDTPS